MQAKTPQTILHLLPILPEGKLEPDRYGKEDLLISRSYRFTQSGIVKIYVGPKRKLFEVHKELLIAKSGYFRRCLTDKTWEEARTGEVYWEAEKVEHVEHLVDWLYGLKVDIEEDGRFIDKHIKCYQFANVRDVAGLKNEVIDGLGRRLQLEGLCPHCLDVSKLRDEGFHGTALYSFMLNTIIHQLDKSPKASVEGTERVIAIRDQLKGVSNEFLVDVVEALVRFKAEPFADPTRERGCCYHDHSDGSKCQDTQT